MTPLSQAFLGQRERPDREALLAQRIGGGREVVAAAEALGPELLVEDEGRPLTRRTACRSG